MNHLYYGDNLNVLRDSIASESVDLIYLDPPFNSKRDYNLLFKSPKGAESQAQIEAFEDTWHWNTQAEQEFDEILHQSNTQVAEMMKALRSYLGENDMMAYLTLMANRLLELHRVLKSTGSLYLHCDPTASHYLKVVLDGVFRKENYRTEISWKRQSAHNDAKQGRKQPGNVRDVIFFYTKTGTWTWNWLFTEYSEDYLRKFYRHVEPETGRIYQMGDLTAPGGASPAKRNPHYEFLGVTRYWRFAKQNMQAMYDRGEIVQTSPGAVPRHKRYLDVAQGVSIQNNWDDILPASGQEFLGYPTQKPLALLERIISSSSNEGDVVLDPFCGCGTAVDAAQKLKRKWIGIDITHLAISLIEKRLKDRYGARCKFDVHGTPKDLDAARYLAELSEHDGRYQFQFWAVSLVNAQPAQGKKKGADKGVDGIKFFRDLDRKEARKVVVSVKSGKLKADDIRALATVRQQQGAEIALLITLDDPSKGMTSDAAAEGFYASLSGKKYARVQILTIARLLDGSVRAEHPDYEPDLNFKKAPGEATSHQTDLL
jgi:DNA modification methylase